MREVWQNCLVSHLVCASGGKEKDWGSRRDRTGGRGVVGGGKQTVRSSVVVRQVRRMMTWAWLQ